MMAGFVLAAVVAALVSAAGEAARVDWECSKSLSDGRVIDVEGLPLVTWRQTGPSDVYDYSIHPCFSAPCQATSGAAACQQSAQGRGTYDLCQAPATLVATSSSGGTLVASMAGGVGGRTCQISFVCDETAGIGTPTLSSNVDLNYEFTWSTAAACAKGVPSPPDSSPPLSLGNIVIIVASVSGTALCCTCLVFSAALGFLVYQVGQIKTALGRAPGAPATVSAPPTPVAGSASGTPASVALDDDDDDDDRIRDHDDPSRPLVSGEY